MDVTVSMGLPGRVSLLQRGWLSANSVVLTSPDSAGTVVDTGYVSHSGQTVALVEHALGSGALVRIVNTHLHSDHCGGNAALRERWPGATISVPSGYRSAVQPWNEDLLSFRQTGQRCTPFTVDAFVQEGDVLELGSSTWEVHAAPGHDPDAVMYFEPRSRTLVSGDALWERRLAIIFPELHGESGFPEALRSLDKIERLAPRWVLPGHGAAFMDVAAALRQSRQRVERFISLPQRHRDHAVRALVIYHMLEHRRRERSELTAWMAATPVFRAALQSAAPAEQLTSSAQDVVESLIEDGFLLLDASAVAIPEGAL